MAIGRRRPSTPRNAGSRDLDLLALEREPGKTSFLPSGRICTTSSVATVPDGHIAGSRQLSSQFGRSSVVGLEIMLKEPSSSIRVRYTLTPFKRVVLLVLELQTATPRTKVSCSGVTVGTYSRDRSVGPSPLTDVHFRVRRQDGIGDDVGLLNFDIAGLVAAFTELQALDRTQVCVCADRRAYAHRGSPIQRDRHPPLSLEGDDGLVHRVGGVGGSSLAIAAFRSGNGPMFFPPRLRGAGFGQQVRHLIPVERGIVVCDLNPLDCGNRACHNRCRTGGSRESGRVPLIVIRPIHLERARGTIARGHDIVAPPLQVQAATVIGQHQAYGQTNLPPRRTGRRSFSRSG